MNNYYMVEWEMFDPLFDDGMTIGTDIHNEVLICGWKRACELFMEKVNNQSCHACFVTAVHGATEEPNDPILSYCP